MRGFSQGGISPELSGIIARVVSPRHGLITGLFEQDRNSEAPSIQVAHAVVTPPAYFRANIATAVHTIDAGTGAGFDRETACWAALGEAIERYAASLYWEDQLVFGSEDSLKERCLDLRPLIRIAGERIVPYAATADRNWLRGLDLFSLNPILVPASLCVLGYKASGPAEFIAQNDSTGLACGQSFEDAALRAMCEVIERDAFAANWLLNRAPPRIVFSEDDLLKLKFPVVQSLSDPHLHITLHHLAHSFGVHVVMGVANHQDGGFGVVSAAASPSPVRAVEKAVAEVLHGWTAACVLRDRAAVETAADIRTPSDHVRYYLDPCRFKFVKRLTESTDIRSFGELARTDGLPDLAGVADALKAQCYIAAAVDVTPPDVIELGLNVVRVVVPGLQPLVFGGRCMEVPDARRLDVWRRIWGLGDVPLNSNPHPFP